jgi:NAD(P)-dependent dehydrogenase (short-subunit alcohol dehydrogenase family)
MSFKGSTLPLALITGGANGIGLATARQLAKDGYDLFLIDKDEKNLAVAVAELKQSGKQIESLALDLSDAVSTEKAIIELLKLIEVDAAVNIRAQYLFCKHIVPQMISRGGGSIVNVASAGALVGLKNRVAYCSSKAAVVGLTRCIAADHAMEGIRVNAIAPGTVDSTWIGRILADDPDPVARRKMMEARQLDGKMGTPEEVAYGIAFLLSKEGRFVNGSVFSMDAGLTAV